MSNFILFRPLKDLWKNRQLIKNFSQREILSRYKGSFFGLFWSFLTPLIMITVYTFVFSVVFKGKWGQTSSTNPYEFAVIMFCGLIVFNIFNETVNRAPTLITSNVNYVKKVIFPLEILPLTVLVSSLLHASISVVILLIATNIFIKISTFTVILGLIILVPLIFLTVGVALILAALGVYVRDISYTVTLLTNVLFYITPIFYPIEAVPVFLQKFMYLNPLTVIVNDFRRVMIWGESPNWTQLGIMFVVSYFIFTIGYFFFKKIQRGFADVL